MNDSAPADASQAGHKRLDGLQTLAVSPEGTTIKAREKPARASELNAALANRLPTLVSVMMAQRDRVSGVRIGRPGRQQATADFNLITPIAERYVDSAHPTRIRTALDMSKICQRCE